MNKFLILTGFSILSVLGCAQQETEPVANGQTNNRNGDTGNQIRLTVGTAIKPRKVKPQPRHITIGWKEWLPEIFFNGAQIHSSDVANNPGLRNWAKLQGISHSQIEKYVARRFLQRFPRRLPLYLRNEKMDRAIQQGKIPATIGISSLVLPAKTGYSSYFVQLWAGQPVRFPGTKKLFIGRLYWSKMQTGICATPGINRQYFAALDRCLAQFESEFDKVNQKDPFPKTRRILKPIDFAQFNDGDPKYFAKWAESGIWVEAPTKIQFAGDLQLLKKQGFTAATLQNMVENEFRANGIRILKREQAQKRLNQGECIASAVFDAATLNYKGNGLNYVRLDLMRKLEFPQSPGTYIPAAVTPPFGGADHILGMSHQNDLAKELKRNFLRLTRQVADNVKRAAKGEKIPANPTSKIRGRSTRSRPGLTR